MKGSKGINSEHIPSAKMPPQDTRYAISRHDPSFQYSAFLPRRPARSHFWAGRSNPGALPKNLVQAPDNTLLRLESSCVDDPGEPSHFVPSSRTFSNYEHSPPLQGWCVEGRREYLRVNGYRHCPYHRLKYPHPSPRPINLKTYQSADVCDHYLQDAQHTAALGVEQVT